MKIVLASGSPRRKELLKNAGVEFEVVISNANEEVNLNLSPKEYAKHLSYIKAKAVYDIKGGIVIGADTIVVLNNQILGKPSSVSDAKTTLKKLSGNTHSVITGYTVITQNKTYIDAEETKVEFNLLSNELIEKYINTKLPLDKAGSYGIQDGFNLVKKIDGDYDNVVGLPTSKILEILMELK